MGMYVQQVPVKFVSVPVTPGTIAYLDTMGYPFPITVVAVPGATGSLLVEFSCTPYAAGKTTTATWLPWTAGAVSAAASGTLISPVAALRFTATTVAGVAEVNA